MKKLVKPFLNFIIVNLLLLFSLNAISQTTAPVSIPTGGFNINGQVKVNSAVGDWTQGTAVGATGGWVLEPNATPPPTWKGVNTTTTKIVRDDYDNAADMIFTGSSFGDDPNTWKWTTGKATSKCDINNALFHSATSSTQKWLILGGDRFTTTGTSYIDFQFSQGIFRRNANGTFSSLDPAGQPLNALWNGRTPGDFVLSMEYTNGGAIATVHYYEWKQSSGTYKFVESPIPGGTTTAFGASNTVAVDVPYGAFGGTSYIPFAFVEAAVNIDAIFSGSCQSISIKTVFVSTKASDSYNAALKDFVEPQPVDFIFGNAGLSYGSPGFCKNAATNPAPTIPASPAGTFSGSPGLHFVDNPSTTGVIDLAATDAGTYTATYTPTGGVCLTPATTVITIHPVPTVGTPPNQTLCNGVATNAVTFSGTPAGVTYSWTNNTPSIGLGASGSGNISSFIAANSGTTNLAATLTVTPTANSCVGSSASFTITVKPTPTVNVIPNQTLCNNTSTTAVNFSGNSVAGVVYNWTNDASSIGLDASGSGNIASFTAVNSGTSNVVANINVTPVANSCSGSSQSFTITVKPTPTVNVISNQTLCNGASTSAVNFSGNSVAGVVYNWANNTPSIGIASSGSGNIASFTATNSGTSNVTATITVTPVANSCTGSSQQFTITVKPTPTVNDPSDLERCNGAATGAINFSGNAVSGVQYNWSNNTISINLGASGSGNISSFNAANSGSSPVTATITVTPVANGCTGPAQMFTITVNPNPTVTVNSPTKCSADAAVMITATPNPAPGGGVSYTYSWTTRPAGVLDPGNVASFSASVAGQYGVVITRVGTGCTGSGSGTLSVNDNPATPSVCVIQPSLCGPSTGKVSFTDLGAGYTYSIKNGDAGQWHSCPVFLDVAAGAVTGLKVKSPAGCVSAAANCNTICQSDPVACGNDVISRSAPQQMITVEDSQPKVKAYPNPFSDRIKFVVTSPVGGDGNLEIYNMAGQKVKTVYTGFISAGTQNFELSLPAQNVSTLVYVLRIGDKKLTGKIVQVNK